MTLPMAIGHIEGFYRTDIKTRPQRLNNPGDLEFAPWMEKYGARLETIPPGYHEQPRFACFPDASDGFAALHALLSGPHYVDLTIEQAINRYAPPCENDTRGYVDFVCSRCGCRPTDRVGDVLANG